jgi:hypothetical protein
MTLSSAILISSYYPHKIRLNPLWASKIQYYSFPLQSTIRAHEWLPYLCCICYAVGIFFGLFINCKDFFVAQIDDLIRAYAPTKETKLTNDLLYLEMLALHYGIWGAFFQIY